MREDLIHHTGQLKAERNWLICNRTTLARDDASQSEGEAHHCPDRAPSQECHPRRRGHEGRRLRTAHLQVVKTSWLTWLFSTKIVGGGRFGGAGLDIEVGGGFGRVEWGCG
jgi:hypothetical protein